MNLTAFESRLLFYITYTGGVAGKYVWGQGADKEVGWEARMWGGRRGRGEGRIGKRGVDLHVGSKWPAGTKRQIKIRQRHLYFIWCVYHVVTARVGVWAEVGVKLKTDQGDS